VKVAVGSTNPVKINATKQAFEKVWPNKKWEVIGLEISSGVSNQPMSDEEAIKGAKNRAKTAIKKLNADFGVGLEGGLQQFQGNWFDTGWIVILDKNGNKGIGSTIRMINSPKIIKMVKNGVELGHVDDIVFKKKNSKHGDGHFGLMTKNALTRTSAYTDGVISALVRFINPELFK